MANYGLTNYECEKYITTPENLQITIEKYGVAIIPEVLNNTECNAIVDGIWNYFQQISQKWEQPILRTQESSWRRINDLLPLHGMLFQNWWCGHSQVVWDVRQNKKIIKIFSDF